jgi:hypothetical protein
MRVYQIEAGERPREFDLFRAVECPSPVMSEGERGKRHEHGNDDR